MAAIALYAGGYHLIIYLTQRSAIKYLAFAALCFSIGLYEVFCAGLYTSNTIEEGIYWQRFQLESIALITLSVAWIVAIYTGRVGRSSLKSVAIGSALLIILSRALPAQYTLSVDKPVVRHIGIDSWFEATYFESEIGVLYILALVLMFGLYIYLLALLWAYYRRKRDRETLFILASQIPLFVAAANDSLVASQVYQFIYLTEYAFVFILFSMTYVSFSRFLRLYNELADSNHSLEDKVTERTTQIRKLYEELQRASEIDGLTGAYNRRFLDRYLELETRRAIADQKRGQNTESSEPAMNFGLAIFDVDDFKQINDDYGHLAGDKVLAEVADRVRDSLFERDVFCRYGGEEFVVIFTRTSRQGMIDAAEKLRQSVKAGPFVTAAGIPPLEVTVSGGKQSVVEIKCDSGMR